MPASSVPVSSSVPPVKPIFFTRSFNSSTMRCASFGPTPLAFVNFLLSPEAAAMATPSGVISDKMESAAFGPTPLMVVSIL